MLEIQFVQNLTPVSVLLNDVQLSQHHGYSNRVHWKYCAQLLSFEWPAVHWMNLGHCTHAAQQREPNIATNLRLFLNVMFN
ncbi:hypothetical protein Ae201684P_020623 [Aphanomyces euteiches]|nr:hypothetical protein Ae201684P_020623 [Aphanomyces euteiches]